MTSQIGALTPSSTHSRFSQAVWRESVINKKYGLECQFQRIRPFEAGMRFWDLGPVKLARMLLNGQSVSADRRIAHSFKHDDIFLKLIVDGSVSFEFGLESIVLGKSSMILVDPTRDFKESFLAPTNLLLLTMPKQNLRSRGFVADVDKPTIQDNEDPNCLMLKNMIMAIAQSSDSASTTLKNRIGEQLLDLMDVLVTTSRQNRVNKSAEATRIRIKYMIKRHLGNPEFGASEIAAAINLSPRHINRMFQAEGTSLIRFLWSARLDRAHQLLTDPLGTKNNIEEIAWLCGFAGPAQFSRAFKRRYGFAPNHIRTVKSLAV